MPSVKARRTLVPRTLGSRLMLTMIAAAIVVFIAAFAASFGMLKRQSDRLAMDRAQLQIASLQAALDLETREVESFVLGYAEWTEFYDNTLNPDPTFIDAEVDPWLAEVSGATVIVWIQADGTSVFSHGPRADTARLVSFALDDGGGVGLMSLPSGPSLVAALPITGDPPRSAVGYVAVARPVASSRLGEHADSHGLGALSVTTAPKREDRTAEPLESVGWFVDPHVRIDGTDVVIEADLVGMDGTAAGSVVMRDTTDLTLPGTAVDMGAVIVGIGLLTGVSTLLVGHALSRTLRKPLRRIVDHMRDHAYDVIEGQPYDHPLEIPDTLPTEYVELARSIRDLLTMLSARQVELKAATAQTLAAEQAFRMVVNDSPEMKLLVSGDEVTIANPAVAACVGRPLGALLNQPLDEVFKGMTLTAEDGTKLTPRAMVERALVAALIVSCTHPDRPARWMSVSATRGDHGPDVIVMTARNITEERRLEALRAEIVSIVSHDLRAPLSVIDGYLDMLESDLPAEARVKAVRGARKGTARMGELITGLVDATRAEQVLAPDVMEPVFLDELAVDVASFLVSQARHRVVLNAEEKVCVRGDEKRLRQALTNVLTNAAKFAPAGTDITVSVRREDSWGVITVDDEGPGIAPEDREHIFERFTRVESRGRKVPGLGLGLYIVAVITRHHGGSVEAGEAPGGGARMTVRLPLCESDATEAP